MSPANPRYLGPVYVLPPTANPFCLPDADGTITHPPWNPSPAEFEAYREREVAMCRAARFADPVTQGRDMLFSRETWGRAAVRA